MKKTLMYLCALGLLAQAAWLLFFVAERLIGSMHQSVPWFITGIAVFGLLLAASGVCIVGQRPRLALVPLTAALVFSLVRWVANLQYVFPFASGGVMGKQQPSVVIQIWQSQQFSLMLFVFIVWLITAFAAFRKSNMSKDGSKGSASH